jgi:signal transduction histidine kinase/DNA-binding response OmpR family regulator
MSQIATLHVQITPQFWKSQLGYFIIFLFFASLSVFIFALLRKQFSIQNRAKAENAITEKRIEYYTNISHEFKTPLSLILNPVDELISSHKSSDFARQQGMHIKKNAIYLKRLIDQILDFRKIREGKMQLKVSEINIFEFIREIYLVFLPLANKMKIVFDFECDEENILGYVDVKQLEKIIYNLLSNAFRFTPAEKAVTIYLNLNNPLQQIELRIEDEGVGIDEKELPKIFERFYTNKSSSGIGLFFTREMVLLHHGEINVVNNKKGGASFTVVIPIAKDAYKLEEIEEKNAKQLSFNLQSIDEIETIVSHTSVENIVRQHNTDYIQTVLVVEDNNEMRNYLCSELSNKYKIFEANDGLKGIELAQKHLPSLILCDVNIPGTSGFDLTQTLKENFDTSHIPIIIISGESSDEKLLMGAHCGADEYITKPFNLSYLLTRIEKLILDRKKLRDRFERDAKIQSGLNENISREMVFINKVQDIIKQNLSNPNLNVDFLVNKFGISRTLFFKRMKSTKGFSPNEFLRIVRMKEAANLIATTDKSISEVGNLVGYSDSNYFSKTFKKHFGRTPSEFKLEKSRNNVV